MLADWRSIVQTLEHFLAGPYHDLPHGAIHGDFGPCNALTSGARITAILDFEFALRDARALDLASGFSMTMRHRGLSLPEALSLGGAFCAGYARIARPTPDELAALPQLMLLREVVGAIWWLGRARVAGDLNPWFARFATLLTFRDWLIAHEHQLGAAIASASAQG